MQAPQGDKGCQLFRSAKALPMNAESLINDWFYAGFLSFPEQDKQVEHKNMFSAPDLHFHTQVMSDMKGNSQLWWR